MTQTMWQIGGVWLLAVLAGLPLYAAMGLAAFAFVLIGDMTVSIVPQKMAQAMNSFPLIAAPLFILMGNLLGAAKLTDRIVAFAEGRGCSTRHLLEYFGEALPSPCGHCGRCMGTDTAPLPRSPERDISIPDLQIIRSVRAENHASLRGVRQLARFLCGISSPATIRERLTRHDAFGFLEGVPFQKVLEQLEAGA